MWRVSRTIALVASICALTGIGGLALRAALAGASTRSAMRIGSAPRAPAGSKVVGSLASSTRIQATVTLNPQDPAALAAYATDVATPGSSVYHRYLSVEQFRTRFGATASQVQAVKSALRAGGLHPGPVTPNNLSIPVSGTAAQLAKAFSTGFQTVQLRGGRRAFKNTAAPLVPGAVAGIVQGVIGLDNLVLAQPMGLPRPVAIPPEARARSALAQPGAAVGSGPAPCSAISGHDTAAGGPYTMDRIAAAYGFGSLYPGDEGSGQTVAIYELEQFSSSDITNFVNCYPGITSTVTVTKCSICTQPASGPGSGEAALDIENVIGLAPKANVLVYEGTNGTADQYNTYAAMVNDNVAKVISTSWGLCEASQTLPNATPENTLFQQAATQGQSIFAASGDHGSKDCGGSGSYAVDDPASLPFVTGVGATRMPTATPSPVESVWNDYSASNQGQNQDSGGGVSSLWPMPAYQSGAKASVGVINSNSSGTPCGAAAGSYCRQVPDVVADGAPATGYIIYWSNPVSPGATWYQFGGTSAAAPLWAAYAALVNASSGCKSSPIGFANPDLYALAGSAYAANFHDIIAGNNNPLNYQTPAPASDLYPAATGYDMASGLGSINGAALTSALCAPKAIGTVALPSGGTLPTGVVVDRTNHVAYIAESQSNGVAKISNTTNAYFATPATSVGSSALPSLNFPDDLALDGSNQLYASNFCVGTQAGICSTEASGTTATVSQQTGASAGHTDILTPCSYTSGDAVFTPASGNAMLFVACAGSGVVNACTTTAGSPLCGSVDASVAVTKPVSGVTPVPSGVAAIPTTTTAPSVVVADAANNTVSVVSWNGTALAASTPVSLVSGCEPASVAIGPASGATATVFVACPGTGQVEVGSVTGTGTPTLGSFTATTLPTTGSSSPAPYGVAVNAAGTDLVVTDSANDDAVAYPSLSGASLGTGTVIAVGTTPDGVGIDGSNAFIANEGSNNVTVVDPPAASTSPGHYVRAHVRTNLARRRVSLTPLVAPLPGR
ncbi:MAG TPA: protease pro-enzyme activation domain-containing protein [Solirubrobacteraceae bacterium]|jgi:DNA-binding beta-propeller fold protein YncE|nr:protease pro-enzyme activation domain-containing protein [Solirubrobacteraceae bacterium]